MYVDINQNGRRDRRETVTEAWQRLGLLKGDEIFNRARFAECVKIAIAGLKKELYHRGDRQPVHSGSGGKGFTER